MNKSRVLKTGNLIEFAENRLIAKVKRGEIYSYSILDIIDNAVKVRKYLDKNKKLTIPKMTKKEVLKKATINRMNYYYKTGN